MRSLLFVLILTVNLLGLHGQGTSVSSHLARRIAAIDEDSKPFVFKPTIGIGTGMFSYFGDLYDKNLVNFQVSRIGFDLSIHQPLTPWLNIGFYTLFGKLGANERLITRNVNFESQIRVGGVHFEYNFGNFFHTKRNILPWISVGFESFEFLSKTDLFDATGNRYHYWSDGSIRNMAEDDPFAGQSSFLQRDYTYETDVRNQNSNDFGRYSERSFAVPVGAGFTMLISERWTVNLGTTFHFSFTDYVDGVTSESTGDRQGNAKNDHYVMTSLGLRYNLNGKDEEEIDSLPTNDSLYLAFNDDDYDEDGIFDLSDSCALTPKGISVDLHGCPLDDDIDNTADYRDKELESSRSFVTDENGIALTDSIILKRWNLYNDSTGEYHAINEVVRTQQNLAGSGAAARNVYMVSLGTFNGTISNDQMMRFLSVPDIGTHILYDSSTAYTAGRFYDLVEAEKRRKALEAQGFTTPTIVYKTADGKLVEVKGLVNNGNNGNNANNGNNNGNNSNNVNNNNNGNNGNAVVPIPNDTGLVFRVQVGAFAKPVSKYSFTDVPNLLVLKTEDGLYKYVSGSYRNFQEASDARAQLLVKGYSGAFIVAYKKGKRIALEDAGAIYVKQEKTIVDTVKTPVIVTPENKTNVEFKIQLGVFKNEPPTEQKAKLDKVVGLQKTLTKAGLMRYTVGNTPDYKAITALRDKMRAEGFPDCFIIAFFNGEQISVNEAIELSK